MKVCFNHWASDDFVILLPNSKQNHTSNKGITSLIFPVGAMKFTVLACASLFCIVTFFHYREIQKRLENNFLRYDDHKFCRKGRWPIVIYGKEDKASCLPLWRTFGCPCQKNCVLKVWEPLSLTLKLLSALVFKNTRAIHLYSSLTFHGLGTCMLYLSIMKILSFLRRQSFQNAAIDGLQLSCSHSLQIASKCLLGRLLLGIVTLFFSCR